MFFTSYAAFFPPELPFLAFLILWNMNVPTNCLNKKNAATTIIGPITTSAIYQGASLSYIPFVYFPASACVQTHARIPTITPNSPQNTISNHLQKPAIQKNPSFFENPTASFSIFSRSSFIFLN